MRSDIFHEKVQYIRLWAGCHVAWLLTAAREEYSSHGILRTLRNLSSLLLLPKGPFRVLLLCMLELYTTGCCWLGLYTTGC